MDRFEASGIPRLEVPASEDQMRMSPDMDRHLSVDEDIDIDLDLDVEPFLKDEDDDMDGQNGSNIGDQQYSDRLGEVANDDDMVDGDEGLGRLDGHTSLLDEDLADADNQISGNLLGNEFEITYDHDRQGEPPSKKPPQPPNTSVEDVDSLDSLPVLEENPTYEAVRVLEAGQVEDTPEGTGSVAKEKEPDANSHALQGSVGDIPWEPSDDLDQEITAYEDNLDEFEGDATSHTDPLPTAVAADQPAVTGGPASNDTEDVVSAKLGNDNGLPQDPYIREDPLTPSPDVHPITVNYQGNEMSLFPSLDEDTEQSQTYLLEHPSVASDSISSLLQQCRSVLADSISDNDELEIRFGDLGLSIDESAAESLETTLHHILEIYLHLSHNDGLENPDPLYIELCIKTRCSSRLDYLLNAVAEDKGLSELDFPYDSEGADEEGGSPYEAGEADGRQSTNEEKAGELEAGATIHSIGEPPLASVDRIAENSPDTTRMPTAMSEGRDRHLSQIDGEHPVDITPNPASGLVAESVANETEDDGMLETQREYIGPPNVLTGKPNDEAAAEEGSVIDYSEDELFHEESSAGSSTLQGDIIDTRVPVVKASALKTDISEVNNADIQEKLTDGLVDLEESQQLLETHNDRHARSHIHDELQSFGHDSFDVTKEASEPGVDAGELDVLLDEDTYDEADIQDRREYTQHGTNEQSGTLQGEIQSELEHSSTDAEKSNNTTVNGVTGIREKDFDELVAVGEQGRTEQTSPSSLDVTSSHTAVEDDEIIYDEDEEEQTDPVQKPAPSPPSLKRGRNSLEGGLEANRFSPDVKRVRSS